MEEIAIYSSYILYLIALVILSMQDIKGRKIRDKVTWVAWVPIPIIEMLGGGVSPIILSMRLAIAVMLLLIISALPKLPFGMGDVKLILSGFIMFGVISSIIIVGLSGFVAVIYYLAILVVSPKRAKSASKQMPLAPFYTIGYIVLYLALYIITVHGR